MDGIGVGCGEIDQVQYAMFLANNSVEVVKTCHLLPIQWEPTVLGVKLRFDFDPRRIVSHNGPTQNRFE
jgi:hypothetical protein